MRQTISCGISKRTDLLKPSIEVVKNLFQFNSIKGQKKIKGHTNKAIKRINIFLSTLVVYQFLRSRCFENKVTCRQNYNDSENKMTSCCPEFIGWYQHVSKYLLNLYLIVYTKFLILDRTASIYLFNIWWHCKEPGRRKSSTSYPSLHHKLNL